MKLLILDGNSVLHRAYYAMPDWRNRSGEATAGVYGFISMTIKAVDELAPTHLIVVFDHPSPTFRHSLYVGYQTNREKDRQISEDIWSQIEKLQIVFEKMKVPVFQTPGFEADDIIGTLATHATDFDQTIIITGDRDMMQLVNDRVNLYMPVRGISDAKIVDEQEVLLRLGIKPEQVIDYKALVGDASDNYPGVVGIGPKTAVELISQYSTFSNIYKNLEKIKETTRKKLTDGYDGGEISRQLATIKTDVPIAIDWKRAKLPSQDEMLTALKELGYKSLVRRAGGEMDKSQPGLFD